MQAALVIVTLALVAALAYIYFAMPKSAAGQRTQAADLTGGTASQLQRLENELEKKRRESEDLKKAQTEQRDEIKRLKRELFDAKNRSHEENDLLKERELVERQASIQLEATRAELAHALADVDKLKSQLEGRGRKGTPRETKEKEEPSLPVQRVIRELSPADKERMERLESQASRDRAKAIELEKQYKQIKQVSESQARNLRSARQDVGLFKDKFRALEKRLNRTLLERDLLVRAIRALEKKSGMDADRLELTSEEIEASDAQMEARHQAEELAEKASEVRLAPPAATKTSEAAVASGPQTSAEGSDTTPTA